MGKPGHAGFYSGFLKEDLRMSVEYRGGRAHREFTNVDLLLRSRLSCENKILESVTWKQLESESPHWQEIP